MQQSKVSKYTANLNMLIFLGLGLNSEPFMFGNMKVKDLYGRSLPRNPLLFGLMQRMNLVEKIGSGLMRIKNAVKEYGLPDIELEADENWFKIIFKKQTPKTSIEKDMKGGTKGGTKDGTKGSTKPHEYASLTEKQNTVLDFIHENPGITINELSEKMQINRSAVQKHIDKLKQKNIIERVGSSKDGFWRIKI